jgi:hypothetical protein
MTNGWGEKILQHLCKFRTRQIIIYTNAPASRPLPVTEVATFSVAAFSFSTGVATLDVVVVVVVVVVVDGDVVDVMAARVNSNATMDTAPPGNAWMTLGSTPRNSVRHPPGWFSMCLCAADV